MAIKPVPNSPLTMDHYATIEQLQERVAQHDDLVQRAKATGMPVEQHEAKNDEHKRVLAALKQHWFTGTP